MSKSKEAMKILLQAAIPILLLSSCSKPASENVDTRSEQATVSIQQVDAHQFKKLAESPTALVLDVRTAPELATGYLAKAVHIDIYSSDFVAKMQDLPKDREILVYCAVGTRSQQAAKILTAHGFAKVYNLDGGIVAWQRNGYEVLR